ncbi:organic cation transporter 1 [Trichonephila clavata]|uniref:Organic cation transporter 1 n=1 Tax=Trichonephila clavata TaxID=2740835 RepID=A0A8X6FPP6_TRICU|nr:organic cation transporter 1 [Trichonephila clavata]
MYLSNGASNRTHDLSWSIANNNLLTMTTGYLAVIAKYIPFLIIGLINLLAGLSAILLPETLNEILPQTIQDAEKFGKEQKCFSCNSRRMSSDSFQEEQSPKLLNDCEKDTYAA